MTRYRLLVAILIPGILGAGIAASVLVYGAAERVAESSDLLVNEAMVDLRALDAFRTNLLEHERLAYEAYGTIQPQTVAPELREVRNRIEDRWGALRDWGLSEEDEQRLAEHWARIRERARGLLENLNQPQPDWDRAQDQLATMTERRKRIEPYLETLGRNLEDRAEAANNATRRDTDFMFTLVSVYTGIIFLIALVVARVFWRLAAISRTNQALAEFPRRNPNPVLTLDASGRVTYANPAAYELAGTALGPGAEGGELLDSETVDTLIRQGIGALEIRRGDRILLVEWHWLTDLRKFQVYLHDITEQRTAENRLRRMAYEDTVTGLPNREGMREVLTQALQEATPGVILISVDRFELMTAQQGFEAADAVLMELARALGPAARRRFGEETTVARLDGALFGVVVPYTPVDRGLAGALRQDLPKEIRTAHAFFQTDYQLGVRPHRGEDQEATASDLLHDADTALVAYERAGGTRVMVYDAHLQEAEKEKVRIEHRIREALRHERGLQLYIQPQVDLTTGRITGGEFLLRWHDPELGQVSPERFIPVVEHSGLVIELGRWVRERALKHLARWRAQEFANLSEVAINVTSPEVFDPDWPEEVLSRLEAFGLPGRSLELEVTERVLARPEDSLAIHNLRRLREAGIHISVDDFGTGYSSLAYLERLPISRVKVAKQFVDPLPHPKSGISLARLILDMAHAMRLDTIAEAVETEEQAQALRAMGCTRAQGYLFGAAMPAEDFAELLAGDRGKAPPR